MKDGLPKSLELAFFLEHYLKNRLSVSPTKNLVVSIGVAADSAHTPEKIQMLPREIRRLFQLPIYDYDFPLRHPNYVICDTIYEKQYDRLFARGYPLKAFLRRMESFFLLALHGGLRRAMHKTWQTVNALISGESDING